MITLSRKEAAALLYISDSTLLRRTKAGQYTANRTGEGQFGKLSYTYEGLGLVEPTPEPVPEPTPVDVHVTVAPEPVPEPVETFAPRPLSPIEQKEADDRAFAARYLAGLESDGAGNYYGGERTCSLLGPRDPDDATPAETQSHVNPALMGNTPSGLAAPMASAGCTRGGSPLCEGLSQEAYDQMMRSWRRSGGGRSEGEQEVASRRAVSNVRQSFGTSPRTKNPTVR